MSYVEILMPVLIEETYEKFTNPKATWSIIFVTLCIFMIINPYNIKDIMKIKVTIDLLLLDHAPGK